jgi:5-dehydro-2-deoxygluconokinase
MTEGRMLDLICMGRTCVDLYAEQEGARLEDVQSFRKYVGGSATNIVVGTARLGARVAMLTRVGDEHMGRFVRQTLSNVGVDVSHVIPDPERLTPYVLLAIREVEDFPRIFVYQDSADMAVSEEDISPEFIASSETLLVTGSHFSRPAPRAASFKAMRAAKEAGTKIAFDIDYRPVFWGVASHEQGGEMFVASQEVTEAYQSVLPDCDLIVGTEEEIRIAGGTTDTRQALRNIRDLSDATIVLKTGAMGATVFSGEIPGDLEDGLKVSGFPVEVFNSVGAGDAFMSGFLRAWIQGEPLEKCGELANACGALVVSRHGCSPAMPTTEELECYLPQADELRRPGEDCWLNHLHRVTIRTSPDALHVLAVDHRWQVEEIADEVGADYGRLHRLKDLLGEAFQQVAETHDAAGVLLDDIYGEKALEKLSGGGVWIARAVEVARSRPVEFAGGPNVAAVLRTWPEEHVVKCMVYCHPQDEPDMRSTQEQRTVQLFDACIRTDHQLLVEIQAPSGMSYDEDDVTSLIERFYELGVRPDWWKLPPDPDPSAWKRSGDVVREHDPYCAGLLVLGQGLAEEKLVESFAAAATEPLCKGFAVGRSIYVEPARRWLADESSDEEFMSSAVANYERMITLWQESDARLVGERSQGGRK